MKIVKNTIKKQEKIDRIKYLSLEIENSPIIKNYVMPYLNSKNRNGYFEIKDGAFYIYFNFEIYSGGEHKEYKDYILKVKGDEFETFCGLEISESEKEIK